MNLLHHEFFVFRNVESGGFAVVYKRGDGGYGMIEEG
jgi:putative sigma-54 modulation protein